MQDTTSESTQTHIQEQECTRAAESPRRYQTLYQHPSTKNASFMDITQAGLTGYSSSVAIKNEQLTN